MPNDQAFFVNMVLLQWETQNKRSEKLFAQLSDEQFMQEVSPGKNTGKYLLGHLAAVNDSLFTMFSIGKPMHPELEALYLSAPDSSGSQPQTVEELRKCWTEITHALTTIFREMDPAGWYTKHAAVNDADFALEPHRNKLNVLITRIVHQGYHLGQIALLIKK